MQFQYNVLSVFIYKNHSNIFISELQIHQARLIHAYNCLCGMPHRDLSRGSSLVPIIITYSQPRTHGDGASKPTTDVVRTLLLNELKVYCTRIHIMVI